MSRRTRLIVTLLIAFLAVSLVASLYALRLPLQAPNIQGVLILDTQPLPAFELQDHGGRSFVNADLKGRWHLLGYGYTYCPDICPITLSLLADVRRQAQAQGQFTDLGLLFYTVDPERDTPERLAKYVRHFDPDMHGLGGVNPDTREPFERGMGILWEIPEPRDEHYLVNHGVMIYLLNPEGELQAVFTPDYNDRGMFYFSAEQLFEDYLAVRGYALEH
ncbi:SCO family protein [Marinimicrobium alkaliphilum]|uniref:SCO family protein n=1 Tax=Marinimicrobium alkaliphilum TaxID=2202654 RepID=UPI0013009788|nr:SCO family protein [Marinimicrobium alkaliphilum]